MSVWSDFMQKWVINSVEVTADVGISQEEAEMYLQEEQKIWHDKKKKLGKVIIKLCDNGEVELKTIERSPIKRVRRITGYLSEVDNFNDAKKAELAQRKSHM